jgi:phosphate transport system protein
MSDMRHINAAFDADLAELNNAIARMGALAETQLAASTEALISRNPNSLEEIIARDQDLDALEAMLNEKVIEVIALRAPLAEDLRRVLVALKVASLLERIGDLAKNIAKRSKVLLEHGSVEGAAPSLQGITQMVRKMLNKALDAYMEVDADTALAVIQQDVEVDRLHTALFENLLNEMMQNSERIKTVPHLLFVAKNIERVGDHITGIAEQIYFLDHGEMPETARPKADKSSSISIKS